MNATTTSPRTDVPAEQGDPVDDARAFRRTLGQFATGVTVVATTFEDRLVGMAANSFSAVSLDPPLVLWSIRKESRSRTAFVDGGHFAVSVLARDQVDVSNAFGKPAPDQFDHIDWTPTAHGDPLISGAIAHFECVTETVYEGGDHLILVGRVDRYARFDGNPLLFAQGQYAVAESHPQLQNSATSTDPGDDSSDDVLFTSLLKSTEQKLSAAFGEHRFQIGVTVVTGRILNQLDQGPSTAADLARATLLGDAAVDDALADLLRTRQVHRVESDIYALTDTGRSVRAALRRSAEQFTAEKLDGIPADDLAAAVRVLRTLSTRV